jgi:hypothetical protein
MRLLVKYLGRPMTEDVVREGLENVGICIQVVLQLQSGRDTRKPPKPAPKPALYYVCSAMSGSS